MADMLGFFRKAVRRAAAKSVGIDPNSRFTYASQAKGMQYQSDILTMPVDISGIQDIMVTDPTNPLFGYPLLLWGGSYWGGSGDAWGSG